VEHERHAQKGETFGYAPASPWSFAKAANPDTGAGMPHAP
jgi:hypothetical protein